ncbi:MAG TPA: SpoIIE family protein phosphatase [Salinivirgaceae bacterium]|nr:SpoIIE family protein phosphatase [Salinivirgaceae bacterium]
MPEPLKENHPRLKSFFDHDSYADILKGIRSGDDYDIFLYQLYKERYHSVLRLYADLAFACNIDGTIEHIHFSPNFKINYDPLIVEKKLADVLSGSPDLVRKIKSVYLTRESVVENVEVYTIYGALQFEILLDYSNTEIVIGYGRCLSIHSTEDTEHEAYTSELLNSRISEVLHQKQQLEQENSKLQAINHDLVDSIAYARKIQRAIFPEIIDFKNIFKDSFVLFSPKEMVSGDMYWFEDYEETKVIAVVDCTGHGVPGAFISTLSFSLLNKILSEKNVMFKQPSELLSELHFELSRILNYDKRLTELKDGMDIGLCLINHKQNIIYFSGAFHNLYYVTDGELKVIRGDKLTVGGGNYGKKEIFRFNTTMIEYKPEDCFYLPTDGYTDQFGGENNKKFLNRRFRHMIEENYHLPMEQQKDIFWEQYLKWKGENDQVDDILVVGFRCVF